MNKYFVPTPLDEATRMEPLNTTITTSVNGTTFDFGAATNAGAGVGYAPYAGGIGRPVAVVVNVRIASRANGDETYGFIVQESADGSTWTTISAPVSVDVSGTVATERPYSVGAFLSQRFVRLKPTLGGTSPMLVYDALLSVNGFPKT